MSIQTKPTSLAPVSSLRPAARPTSRETSPEQPSGDQVELSAEAPTAVENPYDFAPYAENVTAEPWTKDRTPGEGQASRDDHLIGMLENRGFSHEEIYAQDEEGKTMFERVAEANHLEDPDVIQAGQSYLIPSRQQPGESSEAAVQGLEGAYAWSEDGEAQAEAHMVQTVGDLDNASVTAGAQASAASVTGDARAAATSEQSAGDLENSFLLNSANSQAASVSGDAEAISQAEQTVGSVDHSRVENLAVSSAHTATGEAAATATAEQVAGRVEGSRLDNAAVAEASSLSGEAEASSQAVQTVASATDATLTNLAVSSAQTVAGEAQATAEALTSVGALQESTLAQEARVEEVTAATQIQAEQASSAVALDQVVSGPAGSSTDQAAVLAGAQGPASLEQVSQGLQGEGSSQQVAEVEGAQVAVTQQSDAATINQQATNWAAAPAGESQASLNASEADFASQTSSGFESSDLRAEGVDFATMASDAQRASYRLEGGEMVAYHEGKNGTVDVSAQAQERVFFNDGAAPTSWDTSPSGNVITGQIQAPDILIDAQSSESVNGTFGSNGGDTRVELRLPQGPPGGQPAGDRIQVPLAEGSDYLITSGGAPQMLVEKASGDLQLHQSELRGQDVSLAYDLGQTNLGGTVDLSDTEGAEVSIRSEGGNHDVTFQGGPSSQLVVQLSGDAPAPQVVTDPGSFLPSWLGGSGPSGYLPENSQGVIHAPGFENVMVMRGEEIVYSTDSNWQAPR